MSAHRIIVGYYPIPIKLRRIFLLRMFQGVTKRNLAENLRDLGFTISQTTKTENSGN